MTPDRVHLEQLILEKLHGELHPKTGELRPVAGELRPKTMVTGAADLARLFIAALHLRSTGDRLAEQHWLLTSNEAGDEKFYWSWLQMAKERELKPLADLSAYFRPFPIQKLKALGQELKGLTHQISQQVLKFDERTYQEFVKTATKSMWYFSNFEHTLREQRMSVASSREARVEALGPKPAWTDLRPTDEESFLPETLFRAFDMMDDIFQLQYERDLLMEDRVVTDERIFENSGAGVQTSYATAMTAFRNLGLRPGDLMIDLGSGFGRVGIVGGLLLPELRFIGYEFVRSRVEVSQASSERAGMADRIQYYCQDLADPHFEIPAASVYYLYDPFSEATYQKVLRRVYAVSRQQNVTVVTNADAGTWFQKYMKPGAWRDPEIYDGGTLKMFRSIRA